MNTKNSSQNRNKSTKKLGFDSLMSIPKKYSLTDPKRYDYMGSEFKLFFAESETYQTSFGGVLSSILFLVLTAFFVYEIIQLLDTTGPDVSIAIASDIRPKRIDLKKNNFGMAFAIMIEDKIIRAEEIPRYVHIVSRIEQMGEPTAEDRFETKALETINYMPCKLINGSSFLDEFKEDLKSMRMMAKYGVCPNITNETQNFYIESRFQDPPFTTYKIYVYPCIEALLPENKICVGPELLDNVTIRYNIPEVAVDVNNKTEPLRRLFNLRGHFSIDTLKRNEKLISIKYNEISDSTLDFLDPKVHHYFFDVMEEKLDSRRLYYQRLDCNMQSLFTEAIDGYYCYAFISFRFQSSPKRYTYLREYKKVMDALGDFGGLSEVFTMIFAFIYTSYNERKLNEHIRRELLGKVSSEKNRDLLVDKHSSDLQKAEDPHLEDGEPNNTVDQQNSNGEEGEADTESEKRRRIESEVSSEEKSERQSRLTRPRSRRRWTGRWRSGRCS